MSIEHEILQKDIYEAKNLAEWDVSMHSKTIQIYYCSYNF